jgi:predicted small secreted protein
MSKFSNSVISVLAVSALILGISGCKKEETPAEKAAKKFDQTVEKAGQDIKDAGQKMKDAVK